MPLTDGDLIVEDGTGVANANSYATRAEGDAYHVQRDNTDWIDADDHSQILALIRATDYLDRRWNYVGVQKEQSPAGQGRRWPRLNAFDREGNDVSSTLPYVFKVATMEYALRIVADAGRLMPDPTVLDESGGAVTLKREKVGPIEEETRYSEALASSPRVIQAYPEVDRMLILSGLVVPIGGYVVRG